MEVKISCDFIAVFAQRNERNKQFLFIRFLRAVETLRNGSELFYENPRRATTKQVILSRNKWHAKIARVNSP